MRQRNDTPQELVAWLDPVLVIAPGATVECDTPLVGLTILDDPEPAAPAAKPTAVKAVAEETK